MDKHLQARIAEELRAESARRRISGRALSQITGYPATTVSRWLKDGTLGFNELDVVCRALQITIPDLFAAIERTGGYTPTPPRGGGKMAASFSRLVRWGTLVPARPGTSGLRRWAGGVTRRGPASSPMRAPA